jgi:hypothetical protein
MKNNKNNMSDPNNSEDPIGALLVQMANEGKISPEAAGMEGEMAMPAMPVDKSQEEPAGALPETMALEERPMAKARDLSADMPEEEPVEGIVSIGSLKDIEPALTMAVSYVESRDEWDAVSESDAVGIMQVKPKYAIKPGYGAKNIFEVAEDLGVRTKGVPKTPEGARELLFNPEVNRKYGIQYLKALKDNFGDVETALIAYNWGPGDTEDWIEAGRNMDELPEKVVNYLDKIDRTLSGEDVYAAPSD